MGKIRKCIFCLKYEEESIIVDKGLCNKMKSFYPFLLLVVLAIGAGAYELTSVVSYNLDDSIISADVFDVAGEPVM